MPKKKVRKPIDRNRMYLTILTNLNILHSPCAAEGCTIQYKHCSGCNESFPCKTAQVLAGKSVAQLNRDIEEMQAVTIYGDQLDLEDGVDGDDAEYSKFD
jgi:hypothetical protein